MTSRDGVLWLRRFMEAYIPPGPDPENWNERNMIVASGLVPTGPGEMSIYYVEHYRRPTVRLRRASMRVDGIVSVHANFTGGWARTRPFTFEGDELVINYATTASGSIRVEIQDEDGLIIPGGEIVEIHPLEVEQQEPEEWFETDEAAPLDYDQSLSLEDLESILFEEQEIPMVPVDDK